MRPDIKAHATCCVLLWDISQPYRYREMRVSWLVAHCLRCSGVSLLLLCSTDDLCLQAFDTMLLLKRGGETIFNGPLGFQSQSMISYFESIPGVTPTIHEALPNAGKKTLPPLHSALCMPAALSHHGACGSWLLTTAIDSLARQGQCCPPLQHHGRCCSVLPEDPASAQHSLERTSGTAVFESDMKDEEPVCDAGVPAIKPTSNPATWMLEISTVSAEERAGADLTQVYQKSGLCRSVIPAPFLAHPSQVCTWPSPGLVLARSIVDAVNSARLPCAWLSA